MREITLSRERVQKAGLALVAFGAAVFALALIAVAGYLLHLAWTLLGELTFVGQITVGVILVGAISIAIGGALIELATEDEN